MKAQLPKDERESIILNIASKAVSGTLIPFTYVASRLRQARAVHPTGRFYLAEVTPSGSSLKYLKIAHLLVGKALIRLSTGIWQGQHDWLPDILGCAIRFGWESSEQPITNESQDLIFATFKRMVQIPIAPLTTDTKDFFNNEYYTVTSFHIKDLGELEFRLVPFISSKIYGKNRRERVRKRISAKSAIFRLEGAKPALFTHQSWHSIAVIRFIQELDLQSSEIFFSPDIAGKGIKSIGIINSIRNRVYRASRNAWQRT